MVCTSRLVDQALRGWVDDHDFPVAVIVTRKVKKILGQCESKISSQFKFRSGSIHKPLIMQRLRIQFRDTKSRIATCSGDRTNNKSIRLRLGAKDAKTVFRPCSRGFYRPEEMMDECEG